MNFQKLLFTLLCLSLSLSVSAAETPVSYSTIPRKCLSVPEVKKAPVLDGILKDRIWRKASFIEDFQCYKTGKKTTAATRVYFMRHGEQLYMGIDCEEPLAVTPGYTTEGSSVWEGDAIEIFFGSLYAEKGGLQIAFNVAGQRFCDNGLHLHDWEFKTRQEKHRWTAEVRLPLSMINISDAGTRFNICRQRLKALEFSQWNLNLREFAEPEHFGELLFCDYRTAALLRLGRSVEGKLDRAGYEKLTAQCTVPAGRIVHGPYLTHPEETAMTVSWATAGPCNACVEYRALNDSSWQKCLVDYNNGAVRGSSKMHIAHLKDLKPGTKYEYRLKHDLYLNNRADDKANPDAARGTFTTLSAKCPAFNFALFSDIHARTHIMESLWKNSKVKNFTFCVNLGDMVNALNSPSDMFREYIDVQSRLFARHIPIIPARGNHELHGLYPSGHHDYMKHPTGKTYFSFRHGPAFFIVLDSGEHNLQDTDFYEEQRDWLRELARTRDFQEADFRIVMAHFPPDNAARYETRTLARILGDLRKDNLFTHKIHLMIGGHEHTYFRVNPYQKHFFNPEKFSSSQIPEVPFTIVANSGCKSIRAGYENSILACQVSGKSLRVSAFDPKGNYIDYFEILPNGKLNDLRHLMR